MKSFKRAFKILAVALMAGAMAFGITACGDNPADPSNPSNPNNPGGGGGGDTPVVIPSTPAGAVKIKEAVGDLEAAYITWEKVNGATGYNVYYQAEGGSYVKLDAPLVREYKDYVRADAVGLKAGKYSLKVVPYGTNSQEDESKAGTATSITVLAHERTGYAFVSGTSSGAYNEDGTLKANASVVYVTDATKDTVTATVGSVAYTGLQNILYGAKKASSPIAIRLIGKVTSPAKDTNGFNKNANTLLIKENATGITLEGIGSDATAYGWTLRVTSASNVEVRNIAMMLTQAGEPDGITLEKDNHIWVHNCDIFYGGPGSASDQKKGDGSLDTKESTYVTHSYNHFWDTGKCNLQNMHESGDWRITYHHNWYDHSDSRHPRVRSATVHVYNNYFDGNAKYGIGACEGSNIFAEANYFRSTATMKPMMSSMQGTDARGDGTFSSEAGGMIKAYGNVFDGKKSLITQNDTTDKTDIDCYLATSRDEQVPSDYKTKKGGTSYSNFDTASNFYTYEVDTAEEAKVKVEKYAGRVGGGDFKWEFTDATEDSNYDIINELKTALVNYKSDLVKVGGEEVGSGTTGGTTTGGDSGTTGGDSGSTVTGPIEGEIQFIPTTSGSGFTVEGTTKSHDAITVAGVNIAKNSALKLNSSGKVTFNTTEEMTLYLYLLNDKAVKVDGTAKTPTAEGSYYVVSLQISAGSHTIVYGSSENSLYLIKLVPVS